jgi:hypothetical protein
VFITVATHGPRKEEEPIIPSYLLMSIPTDEEQKALEGQP